MSILAALLMLQSAAPAGGPAVAGDDTIIVLERKLAGIEARVGQDQDGRWHCSLSESSGHALVDGNFCRAATACSRAHGNDRDAVLDCLSDSRGDILEDFRRRHASGQR